MLVKMTECEESAHTEELYTVTTSNGQSLAPVGKGAAATQCVSQTDDKQDRDVEVRIMHEKGSKQDGAEQRVTGIAESEDKEGDRRIDGKSVHFSPTQQQMKVVRKKPPTLSIQTHPVICDSTPDTVPATGDLKGSTYVQLKRRKLLNSLRTKRHQNSTVDISELVTKWKSVSKP